MSARGINRNPQFQFDVLSARPSASLCRIGQRFYALDTQQEFVVTPVAGGGRFWFQTSGVAGSADTTLFVNSATGSDTNGDGSSGKPFATLAKAQAVAPYLTAGKARINLIGAGPYTLSASTTGSVPVGPNGQPLVIVGDAYTQVATGSVSAAPGTITTNLNLTLDQYRGLIYHGLTGSSAGQFHSITTNTASATSVLSSSGGTFGAAPGDTFEILQCTTQVNCSGVLISSGYIGFWRCKLNLAAGVLKLGGFDTEVCMDGCEMTAAGGNVQMEAGANLFAQPFTYVINRASAFTTISDIGTLSGETALWQHGTGASFGFFLAEGTFNGLFILSSPTIASGPVTLNLTCYDLTTATTAINGLQIALGATLNFANFSPVRFAMAGDAASVGIDVNEGSSALIVSGTFTGCGKAAVQIEGGGTAILANFGGITGSTGNGVGLKVLTGGSVSLLGVPTATGSRGDVEIDGRAAISWAQANLNSAVVASSAGLSGTQFNWAGLVTGAAGAASFFFASGGLPTAAFSSATAIRTPVTPGRLAQALRVTSLTNTATSTTTFTVQKAPLATGIPAATALTLTVGATTTGSFSDLTHSVTFSDGDQIDLNASNSAAGVGNNLAATASLQMA